MYSVLKAALLTTVVAAIATAAPASTSVEPIGDKRLPDDDERSNQGHRWTDEPMTQQGDFQLDHDHIHPGEGIPGGRHRTTTGPPVMDIVFGGDDSDPSSTSRFPRNLKHRRTTTNDVFPTAGQMRGHKTTVPPPIGNGIPRFHRHTTDGIRDHTRTGFNWADENLLHGRTSPRTPPRPF